MKRRRWTEVKCLETDGGRPNSRFTFYEEDGIWTTNSKWPILEIHGHWIHETIWKKIFDPIFLISRGRPDHFRHWVGGWTKVNFVVKGVCERATTVTTINAPGIFNGSLRSLSPELQLPNGWKKLTGEGGGWSEASAKRASVSAGDEQSRRSQHDQPQKVIQVPFATGVCTHQKSGHGSRRIGWWSTVSLSGLL